MMFVVVRFNRQTRQDEWLRDPQTTSGEWTWSKASAFRFSSRLSARKAAIRFPESSLFAAAYAKGVTDA